VTGAALSLIVTNARIRTGDPVRPWVTALGLQDGKLAVLGTAAEILKLIRADTTVIDAHGGLLALPPGVTMGSHVVVTVAPDGSPTLNHSPEEA